MDDDFMQSKAPAKCIPRKKRVKEVKIENIPETFIKHILSLGFGQEDAPRLYEDRDCWLGMKSSAKVICAHKVSFGSSFSREWIASIWFSDYGFRAANLKSILLPIHWWSIAKLNTTGGLIPAPIKTVNLYPIIESAVVNMRDHFTGPIWLFPVIYSHVPGKIAALLLSMPKIWGNMKEFMIMFYIVVAFANSQLFKAESCKIIIRSTLMFGSMSVNFAKKSSRSSLFSIGI